MSKFFVEVKYVGDHGFHDVETHGPYRFRFFARFMAWMLEGADVYGTFETRVVERYPVEPPPPLKLERLHPPKVHYPFSGSRSGSESRYYPPSPPPASRRPVTSFSSTGAPPSDDDNVFVFPVRALQNPPVWTDPEPEPVFQSGRSGDFGGGGASGSWDDAPAQTSATSSTTSSTTSSSSESSSSESSSSDE